MAPFTTVFSEKDKRDKDERIDKGWMSWTIQIHDETGTVFSCHHEYLIENLRLVMHNWEIA